MTELAHSKLGASSAKRWMNCPGSVALSEGIPPTSSAYADEGTIAHTHAATVLETGVYPDELEPEMRAAIHTYVAAVNSGFHDGCKLLVETRVDLSELHPGLFGTADAIVYNPSLKLLRVIDLKYGKGVPVEVMEEGEGNVQLLYYALGAMLHESIRGLPIENVEITIVQPRCPHPDGVVRSFVFPATDLTSFVQRVSFSVTRVNKENAEIKGGSWCHFCPASKICPQYQKPSRRRPPQADPKTEFDAIAA